MNNKPTLVVLAAGIGSRYGGLKQIDPLGPSGEIIIDYSLYDAKLAGFGDVVFVVKHEIYDDFYRVVGKRAESIMPVRYAFQQLDSMLPPGAAIPDGRIKPYGTAHAVLCARDLVSNPFGVINADDFYGRDCFAVLSSFLQSRCAPDSFCMVGYPLKNTLTENGAVSRGVCAVRDGMLREVTEHTGICRVEDGRVLSGEAVLPEDSIVSVNVWGFHPSVFGELGIGFAAFFEKRPGEKGEYYLPSFVDAQIKAGKARVSVLETSAEWHGVTYKEDRPGVSAVFLDMHQRGIYPALR